MQKFVKKKKLFYWIMTLLFYVAIWKSKIDSGFTNKYKAEKTEILYNFRKAFNILVILSVDT